MVEAEETADGDARPPPPDAQEVFLLMGGAKGHRSDHHPAKVSRFDRCQWILNRLNSTVKLSLADEDESGVDHIDPISYTPIDGAKYNASEFTLTPSSRLTFLSRQYNVVFALDLSPSVANVSSSSGLSSGCASLLALRKCLLSVCQPFCVPNSSFVQSPEILVTILAWSPFFAKDSQVLYKSKNFDSYSYQYS